MRTLLWAILALAAFSAVVSIMPSVGLADWVPGRGTSSEIQTLATGRAVGIFNQPVVNRMVLALGVGSRCCCRPRDEPALAATHRAGDRYRLRNRRVYETHTRAGLARARWRSCSSGALLATGYRTGSSWPCSGITTVAANWSTFTSADREAGGVVANEVDSSPNDIRPRSGHSERKPLEGWGYRPVPVRQHLPPSAVERRHRVQLGYGEVSHQNELAIPGRAGHRRPRHGSVLALAAIGVGAYRTSRMPTCGAAGRPAMMAMAILISAE